MTPLKLLSIVQQSNQLRRDLESLIIDHGEPLPHELHFAFYQSITACKSLTAAVHAQSEQLLIYDLDNLLSASSGPLGAVPNQNNDGAFMNQTVEHRLVEEGQLW